MINDNKYSYERQLFIMKAKSYQNTISITPKTISSFSTLGMRLSPNQKVKTQPSQIVHKHRHKSYDRIPEPENQSFAKKLNTLGPVKTEEFIDEQFIQFLEEIKLKSGFRGAAKTNSRNQLLYLQPKKRYQNTQKSLDEVKQSLYKIIYKKEVANFQKQGKILNYMTEYNPEEGVLESLKCKKKGNVLKMKNSSLRDKLLMRNKRASAYKEKVEKYNNIFKEVKGNKILS